MGFPAEKPQMDGSIEPEGKKWVIAGISLRTPLREMCTKKPTEKESDEDDDEGVSTTPTGKEARIPERLACPPAPRKRRTSSKCNFNGVSREFFSPPDLESVFIRRVDCRES